jgi:hypothetical protein
MGTYYNPRIVTDGLVLALDAANAKSYPKTGNTTYNLVSNNLNGSLSNGASYVADNEGLYTFDGVDDRIITNFISFGNNASWECVFKCTQSVNAYNMYMGRYLPYFAFYNGDRIMFSNSIGGSQQTIYSAVNLSVNNFYHVICTTQYDGANTTARIYVNGVLDPNSATFSGAQNDGYTDREFTLGAWYETSGEPFKGYIGLVRVYNKALTAAEVKQNFNASRGRYGI